jgi:hypothetical protein
MKTDNEIRRDGWQALAERLGDVEAERFVALIQREPFDYTAWQRTLWPERTVADLSAAAMKLRAGNA